MGHTVGGGGYGPSIPKKPRWKRALEVALWVVFFFLSCVIGLAVVVVSKINGG